VSCAPSPSHPLDQAFATTNMTCAVSCGRQLVPYLRNYFEPMLPREWKGGNKWACRKGDAAPERPRPSCFFSAVSDSWKHKLGTSLYSEKKTTRSFTSEGVLAVVHITMQPTTGTVRREASRLLDERCTNRDVPNASLSMSSDELRTKNPNTGPATECGGSSGALTNLASYPPVRPPPPCSSAGGASRGEQPPPGLARPPLRALPPATQTGEDNPGKAQAITCLVSASSEGSE